MTQNRTRCDRIFGALSEVRCRTGGPQVQGQFGDWVEDKIWGLLEKYAPVLVPIIRQVADGLEPLAGERQVAIEIDLPGTPVAIAGDREELLRLFENLIENALKYGASGGKVIVSLISATSAEGGPEIRVLVRDFGPGIAPEHLPRLTERFYRVDVGDSRSQGGTGLGLSLVKHILVRHRGRLLIESVPKNGATFSACFPVAKPPAAA